MSEGNGAGTAVRLRFGLARSPRLLFGLEGGYLEGQSRHVSFYDVGATFFPWKTYFFVRGALGLSVISRPGWVGIPGTLTAARVSETSQGPNALLGLGCAFSGRPGLNLSINLELQHHLTSLVTGSMNARGRPPPPPGSASTGTEVRVARAIIRRMNGRLLELEIDSPALAGNPLGDPTRRPLFAWLPPGRRDGAGLPAVYFLHGFTGSGRGWLNVSAWSPTVPERLDALVSAGEVPPLVGVFVDGWTALGGSQWINSPAIGRYQDYVADDVVGFVERTLGTLPRREARAIVGKSSGGYGALRLGRDRPEVFAHLACHAGDAGFDWCYGPDLPRAAAALLGAADAAAWLAGGGAAGPARPSWPGATTRCSTSSP